MALLERWLSGLKHLPAKEATEGKRFAGSNPALSAKRSLIYYDEYKESVYWICVSDSCNNPINDAVWLGCSSWGQC